MRRASRPGRRRPRHAALWLAFGLALLTQLGCVATRIDASRPGSTQRGEASWYGPKFNGRPTASGEIFDMNQISAAHRTLAFGTVVEVHNLDNGRRLRVRINDRGPFIRGRIIDVSRAAAVELGMLRAGIARVEIRVVRSPPEERTRRGSRRESRDYVVVQIGAFREKQRAEQLRRQIAQWYPACGVYREDGRSLVQIRGLSVREAQRIQRDLEARGFATLRL